MSPVGAYLSIPEIIRVAKMAGADAISLVEKKQAKEAAFRAWIKADPAREAQYGPALAELGLELARAGEEARALGASVRSARSASLSQSST